MGLVRPLEKDGHKITIAKNEKEALDIINKYKFDVIILDLIIPPGTKDTMDISFVGMRLLHTLLIKMKITTPIIVLSVVRETDLIRQMYAMGAKKVLPKGSYLPSKLKEEIYAIIG